MAPHNSGSPPATEPVSPPVSPPPVPGWLKHPARLSFCILAVLALLWLLGLQWFTLGFVETAPLNPARADAIVVLTGGSNRLDTGFDLLKQGLGKKLFISGVYRGTDVKALLDLWKKQDHGGLDCCVELGFDADDTLGNARETVAWLRKQNYTSFYLVTANYHMARALLVFRTFSPALDIIPWPVDPEGLHGKSWWAEAPTRSLILREYTKYLVTLAWSAFV